MLLKKETALFVLGVFIGFYAYQCYYQSQPQSKKKVYVPLPTKPKVPILKDTSLYDESLAGEMYKKVRILCMVVTMPANHKTKAIHVRDTWGRRCNKIIFISSGYDPDLQTIDAHVSESREFLWEKTKFLFQYAYEKHLNDFDFFMKADDDTYIFMENLRHMLVQYNPDESLYFGYRYTNADSHFGYMGGLFCFHKEKYLYFCVWIL
jgi:Fringe-like